MIARIWKGRTSLLNADVYTAFLKETAVPDYEKTSGFKSLIFLKQTKNNECHFTLITFWESLGSIKNFAGEDYQKAKYYPEDANYLLEFNEFVVHHEVFAVSGGFLA
jgi:heme-degrading monooxygenase HmoA